MPTLDPSREGFTHKRPRHRRRQLAPARFADLAELDLGQVPVGEQPLADQLVHRHRRGEHARARVGDVERFEQALNGAVLAERSVQHGEGDVAAEQAAGRSHLDLLAARGPAALAVDHHLDHLVARLAQPAGHRGARAQRDVVLGGAPAGDHRCLHQGVVVVVVVVLDVVEVVVVVSGSMKTPTTIVT